MTADVTADEVVEAYTDAEVETIRTSMWLADVGHPPTMARTMKRLLATIAAYQKRTHDAAHGGWRPIAEAPTSGLMDIWTKDVRRFANCHWDSICQEWRHITACGRLIPLKNATHFMPPPLPPSPKSGG